ncbi:holotricin-1 [Tribolium castaneum]|uniref:holotricin-1 n=1 Tax=Tribolium castaneum TaxID=7070 RepID=UPI0030FE1575
MKFIVIFVIALCVFTITAYPLDQVEEQDEHQVTHIRVRRVTCDLLSAEAKGVKVNHAACAAHCLLKRKRGGYCNKRRICVCRN